MIKLVKRTRNMLDRLLNPWILVLFTTLLCGCSGFSSASTESFDINGQWAGYTDQRQIFTFTIDDGRMTHLEIALWKSGCAESAELPFEPPNPPEVRRNSISTSVYDNWIKITFVSDTEASGTFSVNGLSSDYQCLGGSTFQVKAIRLSVPTINQCITASDQSTLDDKEPWEFRLAPNGACVEMDGKKYIKQSIGSKITPKSLFSPSYTVWIPNRTKIPVMHGWGGPDTRLNFQNNMLWLSNSSEAILKWDGEFYIAVVNFYNPIISTDIP